MSEPNRNPWFFPVIRALELTYERRARELLNLRGWRGRIILGVYPTRKPHGFTVRLRASPIKGRPNYLYQRHAVEVAADDLGKFSIETLVDRFDQKEQQA